MMFKEYNRVYDKMTGEWNAIMRHPVVRRVKHDNGSEEDRKIYNQTHGPRLYRLDTKISLWAEIHWIEMTREGKHPEWNL